MDKGSTKTTINELFKVYKFLQLLIVAQINEMDGLTELSRYSKDGEELQLHLHLDGISTSQLSRKQSYLVDAELGE